MLQCSRESRTAVGRAVLLLLSIACADQSAKESPTESAPPGADAPAPPPPLERASATTPVLVGAADIAHCGSNQGDERTAALVQDVLTGSPNAAVFTAGDNVYPTGLLSTYLGCYEPSWGRFKDETHPAISEHDYVDGSAAGYFDYFGAAAGTRDQGYYSFDLGDWHVVVLNSSAAFIGTGASSPQGQWLKADLAATSKECIAAIFHAPRFRSSTGTTVPSPRGYVRDFWVLLYKAGAEVTIHGDFHWYERFAPQTPDGIHDPRFGIRQFIVGTGGKSVSPPKAIAPNSEVRHGSTFGVLKLTLESGSYTWDFLPVAGATFTDSGSNDCHGPPPPPAQIAIVDGNNQTAPAGTPVPIPPSVRVVDAGGLPLAGIKIAFSVTQGGGTVTGATQFTDADGVATVGGWTLGPTPGVNKLRAKVSGATLSIVFTATGT